ncbi:hypothetical protein [Verminephrobacter eiseniae]|uniref:hypothetical protein n=1 Tax=Verminephrobacter eiseniae TaxID=364317 RepID=UPI0022380896|nr:hypothetical protein [Verminephrobacter eiseniae]
MLAAKAGSCAQAEATLAEVEREMSTLGLASDASLPTAEEQAERAQIATSRRAISQQLAQETRRSAGALARIDRALALLPTGCDERQVAAAAQAVKDARDALGASQRSLLEAVRDAQIAEDLGK